jgi:hypothetical protein
LLGRVFFLQRQSMLTAADQHRFWPDVATDYPRLTNPMHWEKDGAYSIFAHRAH